MQHYTPRSFEYFEDQYTSKRQIHLVSGEAGIFRQLECTTVFHRGSLSNFDEFATSQLGLIKSEERSDLKPLDLLRPEQAEILLKPLKHKCGVIA